MRSLTLILGLLFSSIALGDAQGRVEKNLDGMYSSIPGGFGFAEVLQVNIHVDRPFVGQTGAFYMAVTLDDKVIAFKRGEAPNEWERYELGGLATEMFPVSALPPFVQLTAARGNPSICAEFGLDGTMQIWAGYGYLDELGRHALARREAVRSNIPQDHIMRAAIQGTLARENLKWLVYEARCVSEGPSRQMLGLQPDGALR